MPNGRSPEQNLRGWRFQALPGLDNQFVFLKPYIRYGKSASSRIPDRANLDEDAIENDTFSESAILILFSFEQHFSVFAQAGK
jgi:hypothetical protein